MLDADLLKHLTDEEQTRLRTLESFFEHDGWGLLVEFLEVEVDNSKLLTLNAANWDAYLQNRTKMELGESLLGLPETTRKQFEQIALERQAEEEAVVTDEELEYE